MIIINKYLYIAIGGWSGAILRFALKSLDIVSYKVKIPLNTLIINISGSLLLALFLTIAFEIWSLSEDIRIGISVGFLGSFTTFSSFCKETILLINQGHLISATLYVIITIILGLAFAHFGVFIAREVVGKYLKRIISLNNP